ncbi:uncharacterized protein LOC134537810 isoform X2 [Bacillus rossius redtenbacheri]|uniref:uncharacterized protein LOC134537810 isoform X2 n=1 Tax=Bacillus rossius redtenbacheri TaxID=93214 RepID=UPI002FDDAE45
MSSRTLGCLLAFVVGLVDCYIEPVEEAGCHDATFRLTCRQLDDRIAVLRASFQPAGGGANWTADGGVNASACEDGGGGGWGGAGPTASPAGPFDIRPTVNYRCSGMNHCSFILTADHKPSADWGPGVVTLRYACFNNHMTRFCNEQISVKDEGFVMSPGYPGYYLHQNDCYWLLRAAPGQRIRLSLLDVSLRAGAGEPGGNCSDRLQVSEEDRVLLAECGDLSSAEVVVSQGGALNVSLAGLTREVFPKRGVLFHYRAVGCPSLTPPADGYTVFRNHTDAQFTCCVGHVFPDTRLRDRRLRCVNGNTWSASLPDCVADSSMQTLGQEANPPLTVVPLRNANITGSSAAAIIGETNMVLDVILPTIIICILILGNGVVLYVILYLRKRSSERGDEEELDDIYEPTDGSVSDRAINV